MAELKEFDLYRVARSDGADTGPGYWPVTAPLATAAKKTAKDALAAEKLPRTKPQMMRLAEDDPRFVEWKVKLGILLKQELCPTPDGKLYTSKHCVVRPLTNDSRGEPVARRVSTWILAIRKVQTPMGLWVSRQGQAVQEPARVCSPSHLATIYVSRLPRLLLCTLQHTQPSQERCLSRG